MHRVSSYGYAIYLLATGFPCRGAEPSPDGLTRFLFDDEAEAARPAFIIVKRKLELASAEAKLNAAARREHAAPSDGR